MTNQLLCVAGAALILSGCTSTGPSYRWGSYEDNLFTYYHKPDVQAVVVADHLEFLAQLEAKDQIPAPGLLAEAGTFLLAKGDTEGAIKFYQQEHDLWPESRILMSALIRNLTKEKKP